MRIEIIKSKETSLVIDDIGKAIEEGDILKEGYLKAIHALQRYLDQSRLIRDELKNARERGTDSQINVHKVWCINRNPRIFCRDILNKAFATLRTL